MPGARPIPYRFHWIWLGERALPERHRAWMRGWSELHPGWEGTLWTDANRPALRNEAAFLQADSPAKQADILRYELLLDHGGVYLDTDMEPVRPLTSLLAGVSAFAGEEEPGLIGNAVLGAAARHPWMVDVVAAIPEAMASHWATLEQTGPAFLTRMTLGRPDVTVFPSRTFFPTTSRQGAGEGDDLVLDEAVHAIHHWAKSWAAQEHAILRRLVDAELSPVIPAGSRVALVDGGVGGSLLEWCTTVPFVERDGEDWGNPADDDEAVAALERQRLAGTAFLVILQPAFWWLDHYRGLVAVLEGAGGPVVSSQSAVAFDLRAGPGPGAAC